MAKLHGKNGQVKIGMDVCPVKDWSIEQSVPTSDTTEQQPGVALAMQGQTHLVGIPGWTAELTLVQDKANAAHAALTIGAEIAFEGYDDGIGTGAKYWSGTASVINIGRTVTTTEYIGKRVSLLGQGALTEATVV